MEQSQIINYKQLQRELFNIFDEFFERATGSKYSSFSNLTNFDEQIRRNAQKIAKRGVDAFNWGYSTLGNFYSKHATDLFIASKQLGGMKLVIGGSSRFTSSTFDSIRKMLLYTDTILIPDPILPWIEKDRSEEAFQNVLLLENIFRILQVKPLVDADLPYPAILVFPSWEKSLEHEDEATQEGIQDLITEFFSTYLNSTYSNLQEIASFAQKHEPIFLEHVERNKLFIAPGGGFSEPLAQNIVMYKNEIRTWRSKEFNNKIANIPDSLLVFNGILERLAPQYHLIENANELYAQPMFCLSSHWHYYSLCANMYERRLQNKSLLSPNTSSILQSLNAPNLQWLGNVPLTALVELRKNNENEYFRTHLDKYTKELNSASISDIDRIAAEVGRGIASLLAEHQKQIRAIETKYSLLHTQTAVGGWVTLAALLIPSLAPFVGSIAPLGVAGKYIWDKTNEHHERSKAANSLMGILAAARNN